MEKDEPMAKRKRRRERDPEEIVCGPYNPVAAPMTRDRRVRESTRRDSDPQTERGRQVTAVLEKPEHRRNRTRYLPEVTGITSLSRTDVKTDMRDMDRATQAMVPEEVEENEEDHLSLLLSVIRPPPAVPDEAEARRKRYRKWHRRADDTFFDAARYQRTIQIIRKELRRLQTERMDTEDKYMLLRTHFVNQLQLLKKEREELGEEIEKLERCCETEADLASTRRKHRVHAFKEVLSKLKHQGKRVVVLQEQQRRLNDKLRQLEAMSVASAKDKGEVAIYESDDVGRTARTPVGRGTVETERMDGKYVIKLPFGMAYMERSEVLLEGDDGEVPKPFVSDADLVGRWTVLADSFSLLEGHEAMEKGLFGEKEDEFTETLGDTGGDKVDEGPHEELSTLDQLIPNSSTLLPTDDTALMLFGAPKSLLDLECEGMQFLENVLPEDVEVWDEDKEEIDEIEGKIQELEQQYQIGNVDRENMFKQFIERQEANMKLGRELFELRAQMGELKKTQKQILLKNGYPGGKPTPQLKAAVQAQLAASGVLGPRYQAQAEAMQAAAAAAAAASQAMSSGEQGKGNGSGTTSGGGAVNGGSSVEATVGTTTTMEEGTKPVLKRTGSRVTTKAVTRAQTASPGPEGTSGTNNSQTSQPPAPSSTTKTRKSSGTR